MSLEQLGTIPTSKSPKTIIFGTFNDFSGNINIDSDVFTHLYKKIFHTFSKNNSRCFENVYRYRNLNLSIDKKTGVHTYTKISQEWGKICLLYTSDAADEN